MTNNTLNTILNTSFIVKKKVDGKMQPFTTTMLDDGFKHLPKVSELTGEAKSALNALDSMYKYMEEAATARTDNQGNKAMTKAHEYAKKYLQAVDIDDGIRNITILAGIFAPKMQTKTDRTTKEKNVVGGYTTASTFKRYALYLTHHYMTTGAWCDVKKTAAKETKAFSYEDLEATYIVQFGITPERAKELVAQVKGEKVSA